MRRYKADSIWNITRREREGVEEACKGKVRGYCGAGAMRLFHAFHELDLRNCLVHGWYRGQQHNWNEVLLEKQWYLVDITADQFRYGKALTVRRKGYLKGPYRPQSRVCW